MGKGDYSAYRQVAQAMIIPIILVVAPLLGYYVGMWADKRLDTGNIFRLVGLALGFGAAGKEIYGLIKKNNDSGK
ncbi:MAG: AtpZ/AtpI family protein [candidate division Zixibacteria bacterium]|jgi:F0F1-type ATP synthase assembly protein I|nr:AtpZ/AtpI family protein [candidate division Zixibacteria bacterium]